MKISVMGIDVDASYIIKSRFEILSFRFLTTSKAKANSVGNNCGDACVITDRYNYPATECRFQHMMTEIYGNYSTFYDCYVGSEKVDKLYLFTDDVHLKTDFYSHLMNQFDLPLLPEWSDYLYDELTNECAICVVSNPIDTDMKLEDVKIVHGDRTIRGDKFILLNVAGISEEMLRNIVSKGLKSKIIYVDNKTHKIMPPLNVTGMDDYTVKFGTSLCKKLEEERIRPKCPTLSRSVEGLALLNRKLYAPQAACVNGIVATMQSTKDNYIFVSEEMGCGKTIQAAASVEAYYNQKWLKNHPGKTLKDCFLSQEVNYRVIVICPSHLCRKWKAEVESQIPGAVGILITDISQLSSMREKSPKERNGKEFFIFSKEFAKGDTYKRPVPKKVIKKPAYANVCYDCLEASANSNNATHQAVLRKKGPWTQRELESLQRRPMLLKNGIPTCIQCGGHNAHLYMLPYRNAADLSYNHEGMQCPSCGNLLVRGSAAVYEGEVENFDRNYVLDVSAFASKTQRNERCNICGTSLWEDNVQPLNISLTGETKVADERDKKKVVNGREILIRKPKWLKIKFPGDYAKQRLSDEKRKYNKSGFALKGHELETVERCGVGTEYVYSEREYGPRRCSPARYVKRYLKGYFDILIADEAHQYEGERTEQAMAMHWLLSTVKFTMLLTGTLTNGTATSLFNIHFMTNAKRMRELGYSYTKESEDLFAATYGVVEKKFQVTTDGVGQYTAQGKGRQLGTTSVKPGISPRIYPDLLLDHVVQLNIGDLSNKLPPLTEHVMVVDMAPDQSEAYRKIINDIKGVLREKGIGAGLVPKMMQLGLSYPDKPYGIPPIYSLKAADYKITEPVSLDKYADPKNLLPKEEGIVDVINKVIARGDNIFVYTEYSSAEEKDIDYRLKEIIEKHCNLEGQVKVLKSKDVKASDRELYIKKNASKYRVWITNYRNVETGIDFIGEYEGKEYNYNVIIYAQLGLSLNPIWQSSRRHYRANQKKPCETYYFTYKNTFQLDMLEMMAKRMSAASAIQGNFSESALENMAGSEDPIVVLAKNLMNGGTVGDGDGDDIENQFANIRKLAIEACDESIYIGDEPVTYYDVMGDDAVVFNCEDADDASTSTLSAGVSLFDMAISIAGFGKVAVDSTIKKEETVKRTENKKASEEVPAFSGFTMFSAMFGSGVDFNMHVITAEEESQENRPKSRKNHCRVGQMSFF